MTLDQLIAQLQALRETVPGDAHVQIFAASHGNYSTSTYHREMRPDDIDVMDLRGNPFVKPGDPHYGMVYV